MHIATLLGMFNPLMSAGIVSTAWDRPERSDHQNGYVDFSLILPTYKERENLSVLLTRIDRALTHNCFEVIVVDDDSPDRTWAAAQEFQEQYPWLRVIRRRGARGLSSAVMCGFRHSCGHILGVMDTDLQHDVDLLPALLDKMKHADFAVATRRAAGESDGNRSKVRRFGSLAATALARWITDTPFSDPMSGFFRVRRELVRSIDSRDLRPRGYKILAYVYAKAVQQFGRNELRVAELGYRFSNRAHGRSKLSLKVILDYLVMLVSLRFAPRDRVPRPRWSPSLP